MRRRHLRTDAHADTQRQLSAAQKALAVASNGIMKNKRTQQTNARRRRRSLTHTHTHTCRNIKGPCDTLVAHRESSLSRSVPSPHCICVSNLCIRRLSHKTIAMCVCLCAFFPSLASRLPAVKCECSLCQRAMRSVVGLAVAAIY